MWEETLVFSIQMPQIALVRFDVWDHNPLGREFIGQRTTALTSMMPGRNKNCQNSHVSQQPVFWSGINRVKATTFVSAFWDL